MLQNFKADIIYYNTSTDFELEFNLCGCCRMRLLNDKCADKKTLLLSLSRAFSRSRIIILTAPLFDGNNIIKTVSTAIGHSTETVDAAAYNINSTAPIEITKGSTPLVTADGIFGGCIIESGPQTLIIITENKSVRKNIMTNLIHPYIEEIAKSDVQTVKEEEPMSEAEEVNHDTIITEDDVQDDEQPDLDYYAEDNLVTDDTEEETEDIDSNYYAEGNDLFTDEPIEDDNQNADEDYYSEEDYYIEETPENQNSKFYLALIIISSILLLTIAVLCFCIFFIPAQNETTPALYLKEIFDTMFK